MQHPLNPVSFTKCLNAFHSAISVVVFMFKFKDWLLALLMPVSWSSPVLAGQGRSKKMVEKYDRYQTGGASKWQGKEEARKWHLLEGNKKVAPSLRQQKSGTFSRASCLKADFVRDSRCRWSGKRAAAFCLFSRAASAWQ